MECKFTGSSVKRRDGWLSSGYKAGGTYIIFIYIIYIYSYIYIIFMYRNEMNDRGWRDVMNINWGKGTRPRGCGYKVLDQS